MLPLLAWNLRIQQGAEALASWSLPKRFNQGLLHRFWRLKRVASRTLLGWPPCCSVNRSPHTPKRAAVSPHPQSLPRRSQEFYRLHPLASNPQLSKMECVIVFLGQCGAERTGRPGGFPGAGIHPLAAIPNRQLAELESSLTHSKQTAGTLPDRQLFDHALVLCPERSHAPTRIVTVSDHRACQSRRACPEQGRGEPESPRGWLARGQRPATRFLIANEVHSREIATCSEHTTYEFLIANEFHLRNGHFLGPFRSAPTGRRFLRLVSPHKRRTSRRLQ